MKRSVLASAIVTAVSLVGGMVAGATIGALVHGLPFHAPEQTMVFLASIPALVGVLGGGALWGSLLARIHNLPNRKGPPLAGALGFGLAVIGAALLLNVLEGALVEQGRLPGVPIHFKFTLLFVPATLLVAAIGGSAIALASGNRANWLRYALATGLVASLSFLIVDLVLDTVGMRVGAPHAAERATMLTVTFISSTAAAFSAGAILGRLLAKGPADAQSGVVSSHPPASNASH
jgi:cytochrome bd-type quinol oxidase subunit 2